MPKTSASFLTNLRAEAPVLAGAATTAIFFTVGAGWTANFTHPAFTAAIFVWLFLAMIWCAFGVVRHAEALAEYLGEPFGTLILTISVVTIEVTIMATVMLHGGPNPTLPRDTVFAVMMIVLNGMVGLSVMMGAWRHRQQQYSLQGAVAFLAVISCLAVLALVMPTFTTSTKGPTLTVLQATAFGVLTVGIYAGFLGIQTTRHRAFFLEAGDPAEAGHGAHAKTGHAPGDGPRYSIPVHTLLLVLTLLPVVLLSKPLAHIIDYGIEELHAPTALGGVIIAILVLSPEGLTSFQAARRNQLQRSVNLSLGSALSTIGLTIPTMLGISLITGTPLELGLVPAEAILLVLTLFIAQMTFSGAPTNILLGAVHLVLFATFVVLIFNP